MVQIPPKFADLSERVEAPTVRVLSMGLGVQSTVMGLMAEYGFFESKPDFAVFSDTRGEPREIHDHLTWLRSQLSFPIIVTAKGDLEQETLNHFRYGTRASTLPWKMIGPGGKKGQALRQCTSDHKIRPVRKAIRDALGIKPRARVPKNVKVEQWLGISTDEVERQRTSDVKWLVNRYPLFEVGFSRTDCINLFSTLFPGRPLVKSACVFCPFKDNAEWRRIRRDPEAWARAVAIDEAARAPGNKSKLRGTLYLHHSRVPLVNADLGAEDAGEGIENECEGMCGV